jgi:hypothetical protein
MMDDVVGLVMVQVISNLGGGDVGAVTIVRPVLVSIAFAVVVPLVCWMLVKPLTSRLNDLRMRHPDVWLCRTLRLRSTAFTLHTAILLALVTSASYAGTSNLFASYLAGASISWWDSDLPHPRKHSPTAKHASVKNDPGAAPSTESQLVQPDDTAAPSVQNQGDPKRQSEQANTSSPEQAHITNEADEGTSGSAIYERYYHQAVARILQPLFFASIGFSIPITRMFQGEIVWRGIVYTVLMTFGKVVCGLWLVRFTLAPSNALRRFSRKLRMPSLPHFWGSRNDTKDASAASPSNQPQAEPQGTAQASQQPSVAPSAHTTNAPKPCSLHPPLILACAMTARGEIGFLISSVAESNGVFSASKGPPEIESDIFLVVTWAIVLCTIIGPLGVGLSVRRVKTLETRKNREQEGAGRDVLGAWGVD